jgi:hypothetical protein
MVQTVQGKEEEVSNQFLQVLEVNPYEYVAWKHWNALHHTHKMAMIKRHNKYLKDYKLL